MYKTDFKTSVLWRTAVNAEAKSSGELDARRRIESSYDSFRERAAILAAEISHDLPSLTDHSVHHLDALWVLASEIAGPDYRLTPLEAFVFGGAILLHDLANSLVAFPGRIDDLRGREWDDQVVSVFLRVKGRRPEPAEIEEPPESVRNEVIFARLRQVHATAAVRLATKGFVRADDKNERQYLIEDEELRETYGELIGRIANSHHWSMQRVEEEFSSFRVSGTAWFGWQVDALKLACLLRCADASHLDLHRASSLLMSLRSPAGVSATHWKFQNRLHPAALNVGTGELEFRSTKPFERQEREAWWMAFDMVGTWADGELRASDRVLRRNGRTPFRATGAAGVDNPEAFRRLVETAGWEPVDIAVRITDVASVIDRFGGRQLYGSSAKAPLRELIANGADAIRARRNVPDSGLDAGQGSIVVRLTQDAGGHVLEVEDEGIGMSENVLRGPLLDFGSSFWASPLATKEFPGLLASEFRPTGKFGIGFFSVFMLGGQIKVTTKRYDASKMDTQVLELTRGFRYPMLRRPDATARDEILPRGGTRVRVALDHSPWEREGIVGEVTPGKSADEAAVKRTRLDSLKEQVARIAPAVDVDVWVEVDGEREIAVHAADWVNLEFEALLDRIGSRPPPYLSSRRVSDFVCEPMRDGSSLGRFRLIGDGASRAARTALTVGGFSAFWRQDCVEGVVLGESPVLSRDEGELAVTDEEFDQQLALAVEHGFMDGHPPSPKLATFLLSRGVLPEGLRCYITKEDGLTLRALRALASTMMPGDELVLVEEDSFEFESEFGNSETVSLSAVWDRLSVEGPPVIVARGERSPHWGWVPMSDAPDTWSPGERPPRTLLQLAVLSICREWGVRWQALDSGILDDHLVGRIELRGGGEFEVRVRAYRMVRPEAQDAL